MRHAWTGTSLLLALAFSGCAAQGAIKGDDADVGGKTEAVLGAACTTDDACDPWEHCDRVVCIRHPCPDIGSCRDITWFYDNEGAAIPDASSAGVTRSLTVLRPDATVASLAINLSIAHTYRGDLQVVLRSPAGTEVVLHDREGGSADDLQIAREVPEMAGETAAGDWQLVVRDLARADMGRIETWSLNMTYSAAPPPDGDRNVWAEVALSGIESAHPYTNRFTQTWDLRPFTGGGARARVHFETIDVERNYDFVEVLDAETGVVLDRFTGLLTDLTTRDYDTSALAIRLTTDVSITRWGFRADRVDVFGAGCLADADCGEGRSCDPSIVCVRAPCFSQCVGSEPAVCQSGETMNDGCNDCVCVNGMWGCTKRYCPPAAAGEGEACGEGIACADGLTCDRGPTEDAACGYDRAGVCVTQEQRYCRAVYAPVCTCNGQTFPNDCGRIGQGDWAHAGRCELSLAIPDADANGVRHTIHVTTPPNSTRARVEVEIDHTWRGDLVVWVEAPDGTRHVLTNREGGSADDFTYASAIEVGGSAHGAWTLVASDRAQLDVGVLRFFNVIAEVP